MTKRDLPDINPNQDSGAGYHELSKVLGEVDYPVPLPELLQRVGNRTIEVGKGHVISLRSLLQRTGQGQFPALGDVLAAVHNTLVIDGLVDEDWAA